MNEEIVVGSVGREGGRERGRGGEEETVLETNNATIRQQVTQSTTEQRYSTIVISFLFQTTEQIRTRKKK